MKYKLGEIFEVGSGGTPLKNHPEYYDGDIPWIKTGDLKCEYLYDAEDYITEDGLNNSSAKMYQPDTVLIAMYGATIGATSILKISACTNQACAAFKKSEKVLPEYLYYFFKSQKERFVKDGVGGAQPNISAGYLKNVEMEVPTLEKQTEIVSILDKVNTVLEQRRGELLEFDNLIKSRFVELFENGEYKKVTVQSVLDTAFWLMPATPEFIVDGKIPYITSKNIKNRTIDFNNVKYISQEAYRSISSNRPTQKGDILVSMIGTLGQTAVIQDDREFYGQNLYLLRLNNAVVNTTYFCEFFNSDVAQRELQGNRNQSTQAYLKANHVEDLELPLPSLALQKQFATFVEQVDKLKIEVQKSLDETQQLMDSLMQKYFG